MTDTDSTCSDRSCGPDGTSCDTSGSHFFITEGEYCCLYYIIIYYQCLLFATSAYLLPVLIIIVVIYFIVTVLAGVSNTIVVTSSILPTQRLYYYCLCVRVCYYSSEYSILLSCVFLVVMYVNGSGSGR